MKLILEGWREFLTEKTEPPEGSNLLDLGEEADEEVAVCLSDIGCEDFNRKE